MWTWNSRSFILEIVRRLKWFIYQGPRSYVESGWGGGGGGLTTLKKIPHLQRTKLHCLSHKKIIGAEFRNSPVQFTSSANILSTCQIGRHIKHWKLRESRSFAFYMVSFNYDSRIRLQTKIFKQTFHISDHFISFPLIYRLWVSDVTLYGKLKTPLKVNGNLKYQGSSRSWNRRGLFPNPQPPKPNRVKRYCTVCKC